jgi:periplasmic protein TonB
MGYQALLFCTDEKTVRVITQVLSDLEFSIELSGEPFAAVKRLTLQHFDAVVVDCDDEQNAALLFKSARNSGPNHSALAVALVQGQAGIAKAFRIGANLVLTKPINVEQSKGTLRVARGLLRKADAAKSATAATHSEPSTSSATAGLEMLRPPIPPAPVAAAVPPSLPSKKGLPVGPVASASLEVEEEPTPELDATEAALLDSMPAPAPTPAPRPVASSSAKRYPWQSAAKPPSEPISPPSRPSASLRGSVNGPEADGFLPTSANPAEMLDAEERPAPPAGLFSNSGAAAAPAPARATSGGFLDTPGPYEDELGPRAASKATNRAKPAKTSSSDEEEAGLAWSTTTREPKAPAKSGNRGFLVALLIVAAMAAAGYYEWPRLGPVVMNLPIVQKYLHPAQVQTPSSAPPAAVTPPPAPAAATEPAAIPDQTGTSTAPGQPQATTPEVIQVPAQPDQKPDAGVPSSSAQPGPAAPSTQAPAPPASAEKPLLIKGGTKPTAPRPQAAEEVAPPSVDGSSESTDKAVAKIVGTSTAASKPLFRPVRISQGISEGLLVKEVRPIYPIAARQMRVEGPVQLEATIDKEGSISDVKVLSGNRMLTTAAVEAVRHWKYKPYYLNGTPIEIQTEITVDFKLPQ